VLFTVLDQDSFKKISDSGMRLLRLLLNISDENNFSKVLIFLSSRSLADEFGQQFVLSFEFVENETIIFDILHKISKLNELHDLALEVYHDLKNWVVRVLLGVVVIPLQKIIEVLLGQTLPDVLSDGIPALLHISHHFQDGLDRMDVIQIWLFVCFC
jgi:hypothetical protein